MTVLDLMVKCCFSGKIEIYEDDKQHTKIKVYERKTNEEQDEYIGDFISACKGNKNVFYRIVRYFDFWYEYDNPLGKLCICIMSEKGE